MREPERLRHRRAVVDFPAADGLSIAMTLPLTAAPSSD